MRELLMNARLICPLQNIDANGWLLIENGIIADSGNGSADSSITADKITDCKGQIIGPSFVDMRVQSGYPCLLYTSPSPRDCRLSRMPSSA